MPTSLWQREILAGRRYARRNNRAGRSASPILMSDASWAKTSAPRSQEAIDAMPTSDHLTFLVTAEGNAFAAVGFGNYFMTLCDAAGLPSPAQFPQSQPASCFSRLRMASPSFDWATAFSSSAAACSNLSAAFASNSRRFAPLELDLSSLT